MYENVQRLIGKQDWVDGLADPLQNYWKSVLGSAKGAKNVLNGTWLGHPLHPAITDVPVGAWTTTMVLDVAGAVTGDEGIQTAANITLGTGLVAAVGAAATGWTDWSDTHAQNRKVGLLHGLLMVVTTLLYSGSLAARLRGHRKSGMLLADLGLATLSAGAYLGGDEVYHIGYGVNNTAFENPPSEFTALNITEGDLADGKPKKVRVKGVSIMVVKSGSSIFALSDTCVHAGCSLSGGSVEDGTITCPCHGSQYRLADGSVVNGPATQPEPHYQIRMNEGAIEVRLAART